MKPNLSDVMKPRFITCGKCNGKMLVIPQKEDLGEGRIKIYTLMACPNCGIGRGS